MANIDTTFDHEKLITFQNELLADLTAVRTALISTLAKLDADGGVTDTNYASTLTPAALTTTT